MVTLANLGRMYGDVVEKATLSRDLLAPVAAQLSGGDPSDLHRRCVLAQCLGFSRRPDDVRAELAPFGDVEAAAVCGILHNAVVVFRTAAGAEAALRRQAETRVGWYSPVPPLHSGFPACFIQPGLIEVGLYSPTTVPASGEASSTMAATQPASMKATAAAEVGMEAALQPLEQRPAFVYLNMPNGRPRNKARGPPGSKEFVPFFKSKVNGPRLGEDGRLWVDGHKFTYYHKGMQIDHTSIPVVQQQRSSLLMEREYCMGLGFLPLLGISSNTMLMLEYAARPRPAGSSTQGGSKAGIRLVEPWRYHARPLAMSAAKLMY